MSFEPGALFASMLVSSAGFVAFVYGKKQRRWPQMIAGLALMIYPYLVPDVVTMLVIAPLLLGAMWLAIRLGL